MLDFENTPKHHGDSYWASVFISQKNSHTVATNLDFYKRYTLNGTPSSDLGGTRFTLSRPVGGVACLTKILEVSASSQRSLPNWFNLININFLRKERLYTKLKYSRSPAYDTVSGGAAALFAGFLGFLVSEKFGMELVDSGDFYYAIMYTIFLCFSLRPLLTVINPTSPLSDIFSGRAVLNFYSTLLSLITKRWS